MRPSFEQEACRVLKEYQRREREIPPDYYSLTRPANLFLRHGQERALLAALNREGLLPLRDRRILEVGCGTGQWLSLFEEFEASKDRLAGIELDPVRARTSAQRFPVADIRKGDASHLPWDDAAFDIVLQSTVLTSILDDTMKQAVAAEMLRVLKPLGCILWYDFSYNNPNNPHVRGIGRREIARLFPSCRITLRRVTLAPPLARRLVPLTWAGSLLLEQMRFLNTHYFGVIRKA